MLQNKKAVIFDLDGTIADSMWVWTDIDKDFIEKYDLVQPGDFHERMEGMSFTEVATYFKEIFELEMSVEEIKEEWRQMAHLKYKEEVPLKEGVLAFLEHCKENEIKMGIATSNARELVDLFLEAREIKEYFHFICTSCDVNIGKPAPDVYLAVAKNIEVEPEACLVFEDVPNGILAGKNAGMTVCAIEDPFSSKLIEKKKELADYYIETYMDVLEHTYEEL